MNLEEPKGGGRPASNDGPFTLTVDGEIFTVTLRPSEPGVCDYAWESGPNAGYGFSCAQYVAYSSTPDRADTPSAPLPPMTVDEHRESIRDFLSGINPETGYLGD